MSLKNRVFWAYTKRCHFLKNQYFQIKSDEWHPENVGNLTWTWFWTWSAPKWNNELEFYNLCSVGVHITQRVCCVHAYTSYIAQNCYEKWKHQLTKMGAKVLKSLQLPWNLEMLEITKLEFSSRKNKHDIFCSFHFIRGQS